VEVVEVRWHGRGGRGVVLAYRIIAKAAFLEGKWSQAFPFFGAERRGAPVTAFTRIANSEIRLRSQVYEPDVVVVVDPSQLGSPRVLEGLKPSGILLANAKTPPSELPGEASKKASVDATGIALSLGLRVAGLPVPNTAMAGAFARATGLVSLDSVLEAIRSILKGKAVEVNLRAAEMAYEKTEIA